MHYLANWNLNTYVTWRGNEYELPDSVETCKSMIIYELIVIVLLLFILQNNKNAQYMYKALFYSP